MEIIIPVLVLLAAGSLGRTAYYRYRTKKMLQQVSDTIAAAIAGKTSSVQYNEGLDSAIIDQLNQLVEITAENNRHTIREKEIVKSYVSDISHQLKTPVTNLLVLTQLLQEQRRLSEEEQRLVSNLTGQTEKIQFLIKALTKSAFLELDLITIHKQRENIDELIWNAWQSLSRKAALKNITLQYQESGCIGWFDCRWLQEAFENILDNAIKYAPAYSTIQIDVAAYDIFWRINFTDQGPGIRESEQGLIFDRFYRSADYSKLPGLGIGLYLTREIITRHEGFISVRSAAGNGTTFSIFLKRLLPGAQ